MKKILLGLLSVLLLTVSFAQQKDLMIKSASGVFFLEHKAQPHEGLFPIGRFYNVHPRYIASFNKIDFNKGLSIGQLIKIPLTDTNFNQKINEGIPVYYVTKEKETLTNISIKNKLVSMANLRVWNNLTSENLPVNTKLIIGFIVGSVSGDNQKTTTEVKKENPLVAKEEPKKVEIKKENPLVAKEEPKKVEIKKEDPLVIKEEPKKVEIKKEDPPVIKEEPKKAEIKKEDTLLVKEEPKKTVPEALVKEEKSIDSDGGFFKNVFNEQIKQTPVTKEQTFTSSVFKSTSGWKDAKYYLLISGVEPGTIVKITNPANNKVVYAKALYGMEGIRQNEGLDMRISDAAASILSISETDKFILKINY